MRGITPGSTAGESTSLGLRGPTLHIPELRISLPHIEFPSLYKVRHDASKTFDTTRSPLVHDEVLEFDHVESPLQSPPPQAPTPPMMPYYPPACTAPPTRCAQTTDEALRTLQQQMSRLEQLEQELVALRNQQASEGTQTQEQKTWRSTGTAPQPVGQYEAQTPAPIHRGNRYPLETASYEEEPAWDADLHPPVRARRPEPVGRSALESAQEQSPQSHQPSPTSAPRQEFGDWNQSTQRPAMRRPASPVSLESAGESNASQLGYTLQDVFR